MLVHFYVYIKCVYIYVCMYYVNMMLEQRMYVCMYVCTVSIYCMYVCTVCIYSMFISVDMRMYESKYAYSLYMRVCTKLIISRVKNTSIVHIYSYYHIHTYIHTYIHTFFPVAH